MAGTGSSSASLIAGVESDMLSRIDAAVEKLRSDNLGTTFDPADPLIDRRPWC